MGIEGGPVGSVGGLLRRCCARGPTGWQPSPSTISLSRTPLVEGKKKSQMPPLCAVGFPA